MILMVLGLVGVGEIRPASNKLHDGWRGALNEGDKSMIGVSYSGSFDH